MTFLNQASLATAASNDEYEPKTTYERVMRMVQNMEEEQRESEIHRMFWQLQREMHVAVRSISEELDKLEKRIEKIEEFHGE